MGNLRRPPARQPAHRPLTHPFVEYNEVRVMRHTRVAGDPATETAPTHRDERARTYEPSTSNR